MKKRNHNESSDLTLESKHVSQTWPILLKLNDLISTLLVAIIIIGIVGNVLNVLVFSRPKMRLLSTFRFLLYMSIFDLLILLTCATDAWTTFNHYFTFQIRHMSGFSCRFHVFLTYFFTQCGTNVLMLVNIDRAINLRIIMQPRPHRAMFKLCRINQVDLVVLVLVVLVTLVNFHFIFLLQLNNINGTDTSGGEMICYPIDNELYLLFLRHIWTWIDFGLFGIFPFVGMTICSILIARALRHHTRRYSAPLFASSTQNRRLIEKRMQQTRQILLLLLLTTLYFLVTTLPYFVLSIINQGEKESNSELERTFVHLLLYSNNSLHFLFYGFSCDSYRKELIKLFVSDTERSANQRAFLARHRRPKLR